MRVLVVGLGVQGNKRSNLLGEKYVGSVDPKNSQATYRDIHSAPVESYDAVFLCAPDDQKPALLNFCIQKGKHVLVEKPLSLQGLLDFREMESRARKAKVYIYTAYNHRFEPHIAKMRNIIDSKVLGDLYLIRIFYGNGTAQLVKASDWRDQGLGVISDLAPHLLDTLAFFLGPADMQQLALRTSSFETKAPDYAVIQSQLNGVEVQLEMSLCSWRNSFYCDVIGEKGSAHITSLCKWGPSSLVVRNRVLPAGIPQEEVEIIEMSDPTWELEHEYFFKQISNGAITDLSNDSWIQRILDELPALI